MAIEDDVAAVFSDSQVKAIDFSLEKLTVNSHRLATVGLAIKEKRIKVEVTSTGIVLGAAYSPHPNRMTLSNADMLKSAVGRAGVLHEGVHGLVDLFKEHTLTVLQDEAAAYIAEVIYLRAWGRTVKSDHLETKAIYDAAWAIVDGRSMHATKRVKLKAQDCQALITAIQGHTAYAGIQADTKVSGLGVPD
jgi:hypothetical protein